MLSAIWQEQRTHTHTHAHTDTQTHAHAHRNTTRTPPHVDSATHTCVHVHTVSGLLPRRASICICLPISLTHVLFNLLKLHLRLLCTVQNAHLFNCRYACAPVLGIDRKVTATEKARKCRKKKLEEEEEEEEEEQEEEEEEEGLRLVSHAGMSSHLLAIHLDCSGLWRGRLRDVWRVHSLAQTLRHLQRNEDADIHVQLRC